ncbi:MAG: hypothetical protein NT105_11070 [Verrucomicrobia bacterium]|nr:hypothetical protein [Verrucomicrobiota bacterium]
MPFDPSFPPDNSELRASEFRGQFNGLNDKVEEKPTTQQVNDAIGSAINGTPRNVDGIGTLDIVMSDPPTQGEVQLLLENYNALIRALRRNI